MFPSCRLRPGRIPDAAALSVLAMRSKAQWGYDRAFMAACRAELTMTPARMADEVVIVAESAAGEIVAFGSYRLNGGDSVDITSCFVAPEALGTGIGRRLVAALAVRAGQANAAAAFVDSDPHAQGFYERLGFTLVGQSPSGSVAGRRLPRLALNLGSGRTW